MPSLLDLGQSSKQVLKVVKENILEIVVSLMRRPLDRPLLRARRIRAVLSDSLLPNKLRINDTEVDQRLLVEMRRFSVPVYRVRSAAAEAAELSKKI